MTRSPLSWIFAVAARPVLAKAATIFLAAGAVACAGDGADPGDGPHPAAIPTRDAGPAGARPAPEQIVFAVGAPRFELRLHRVTTLQDDDGRAGLASPLLIERSPLGDYLVVPQQRQHAVLVFDSAGYYQRDVGRSGGGPGEFAGVLAIRPARGDSVAIMDAGNRRLAVLGPDLRPARTANLPVHGGWFGVLEDGRVLVMTGFGPRRLAATRRLWLLDPAMEPLRTFMEVPPTRADVPESDYRRRMAVSPAGLIALAHNTEYAVEIWDLAGRHVRTLRRAPAWFASGGRAGPDVTPPRPLLETPRIDGDGLLWTVSHIADPEWKDALVSAANTLGRGETLRPRAGRSADYQDSVVEVIDPVSGSLLAALRLDARVDFVSNEGHVASYRESEAGQPYIDVWRLELAPTEASSVR